MTKRKKKKKPSSIFAGYGWYVAGLVFNEDSYLLHLSRVALVVILQQGRLPLFFFWISANAVSVSWNCSSAKGKKADLHKKGYRSHNWHACALPQLV